jgi:hypothetical protein
MAGVAALLDQKLASTQGNLNPQLYALAATAPASYHDTTVASSGVSSCSATTASLCNNSMTLLSGGAQAGFTVGTGYDQATGLGSLDVAAFLNNYSPTMTTPLVMVNLSSASITTAQPLTVTITVSGNSGTTPTPTGTVTLSGGGYTSPALTLTFGSDTITLPAGSLATGTSTLTASYAPDPSGSLFFNAASGSSSVTVTAVAKITPAIALAFSPPNVTTAQDLRVTVAVAGGSGNQTPSGTVTLTSTGYSSGPVILQNGSALISLLASSLQTGVDNVTANYTPDSASSSIYNSASGSSSITVTAVPKITPTVTVTPSASSITTAERFFVQISVDGGTGNLPPTGTVKLVIGGFSMSGFVGVGSGSFEVVPGSIPPGNDSLTVTYTPDGYSTSIYNTASGSNTVSVTMPTPLVIVTPVPSTITAAQGLTAQVTVVFNSGFPAPTGSLTLTSGSYSSGAIGLTSGSASIAVPAGALALGTDTLTAAYTPDSTIYSAATGSSPVTVTAVPPPSFAISGNSVTISTSGTTNSNNSTITVSPANGFTGSVTLTATVSTSPTGATHTPTLTLTANPVSITSAAAVTTTLTIATTASQITPCVAANETPTGIPWYAQGGAVLACALLFGIAPKRRRWRTMLGALMLLCALAGGIMACGGGKSAACTTAFFPGTTAGSYTITLTGTSGSTSATNTINLTVN